jgi:hypothetical protein
MNLIDQIRSIHPDCGAPTPEPSLNEVVRKYYAPWFSPEMVDKLTDEYFKSLTEKLSQ